LAAFSIPISKTDEVPGETGCLKKNYMFLNQKLQASDFPVSSFGQAYSINSNSTFNPGQQFYHFKPQNLVP
jgi:hypothetical protein